MGIKYYCSSQDIPSAISCNNGIEDVMYLLWLISKIRKDINIYDTASMSTKVVQRVYEDAQIPSIAKKLKIRQIFGSKNRSGFKFGKEVPALIVYDDNNLPIDIYPHSKGYYEEKTIRQYILGLLPEKIRFLFVERWIDRSQNLFIGIGNDLLEFELEYKDKINSKRKKKHEKS